MGRMNERIRDTRAMYIYREIGICWTDQFFPRSQSENTEKIELIKTIRTKLVTRFCCTTPRKKLICPTNSYLSIYIDRSK